MCPSVCEMITDGRLEILTGQFLQAFYPKTFYIEGINSHSSNYATLHAMKENVVPSNRTGLYGTCLLLGNMIQTNTKHVR